jgi:peptide/nickel transport system substrate-binding protein
MNGGSQQPNNVLPSTSNIDSRLSGVPQYGGTLRIANTYVLPPRMGPPGKINVGSIYLQPIIEQFFRVDRTGRLIPHLVESWEFSNDYLQLMLRLKRGIKFHDNTELNAEAAKWNLMKARESNGTLQLLTSIEIEDKYTVLLNLKSYGNHFLPTLAYSGGWVLSPTAYETYGEEYAKVNPVGTGPFKFVSYKPDESIVTERFEDYWQQGKPYLDKIEMFYVKDVKNSVDMLRRGDVDVVLNINSAFANALKDEGYVITALPWSMEGLSPDTLNSDSVLADKKIRQAIEYAIDRKAIAENIGHGYWHALNQLATESVFGYNSDIEGRPYNPEKAKQLIKEAGYIHGFKTKIIAGEGTELPKILGEIKRYLAEVNIDADVEIADATLWKKYRADKPWHNAMLYNHFATDPNFTWSLFDFHSAKEYGHTSQLRNFDNLIDEMLRAKDYDTIAKNARNVVRHIYDEAIVIPIIVDTSLAAKSKKVHDLGNFEVHVIQWTPWDAWIEH